MHGQDANGPHGPADTAALIARDNAQWEVIEAAVDLIEHMNVAIVEHAAMPKDGPLARLIAAVYGLPPSAFPDGLKLTYSGEHLVGVRLADEA